MLAQRMRQAAAFTRRDAVRLTIAAVLLVVGLTAILSSDILLPGYDLKVGDVAPSSIRAPRTAQFVSQTATDAARAAARDAVPPQYDYTTTRASQLAFEQTAAFDQLVAPIDAAFDAVLSDAARRASLAGAVPGLSKNSLATLQGLDRAGWVALRSEMRSVLAAAEQREVRDSALDEARATLPLLLGPSFTADQRALAAELISPLLVANSTYDAAATTAAQDAAAAAVQPVSASVKQGEVIVDAYHRISQADLEEMAFFGLLNPTPDFARLGGWALLAALLVSLLLAWIWRFRPEYWHRDNALVLVALLFLACTVALRLTAGRSVMPFFLPLSAAGLLVAVLLDSGTAIVLMAIVAVLGGAVGGTSVEFAAYVFLGSLAGIVTVRRGDRVRHFAEAVVSMALVNATVVTVFALLGEHDITGVIQLWAGSAVAAVGSGIVALGTFAVLGNLFGITTGFQLLELASPSQPLLRRLLLETPGTYHHSLMVGNLAERAAEAIGADPLLTRVGAYYHDIGKLSDPAAFIENQAAAENVHDYLSPEESAAIVKRHVAAGIDLAYEYRLPKPIIAFIPQHHGTALMSYFYAKAREQAVAAAGLRPGTPEAEAVAAAVPKARFRHAGPKPQSREAAILMLSDGVEASVRSLSSRDEAVIRAMVAQIVHERLDDGQFDECDLTLRDIEMIREAFVVQFLGMYHQRVEYPQNKIVEIESRRNAGGGSA